MLEIRRMVDGHDDDVERGSMGVVGDCLAGDVTA